MEAYVRDLSIVPEIIALQESPRMDPFHTIKMAANSAKRPFCRKASSPIAEPAATLNANGENDGHTHRVSGLLDILES